MFPVGTASKSRRQQQQQLLAKSHLLAQSHLQATLPTAEGVTSQCSVRKHRRGPSALTVRSAFSILGALATQWCVRKHRRGSSTRTLDSFSISEASRDNPQLSNDIYDSNSIQIATLPTNVISTELVAREVLDILTFELVDPYQDLFLQSFLTEFTRFGELPLEIRRVIWALTFPPIPNVHLAIQYRGEEKKNYVAFPVALHTCHDSRVEGLRHFRLFSQTSMFYFFDNNFKLPYSLTPRPICFSPDTHSVSFIFRDFESPDFLSFLLHLQFEVPKCVHGIRKVLIKESVWRLYTKMCFNMRLIDIGRPIYLKEVLTVWRGLDEVELEYDVKSDEEYMTRRGKKDECRTEVRRWFQDLQRSGVDVKIPEVYTSHAILEDE